MLGIILGAYTCKYLYVGRLNWIYTKNRDLEMKQCGNRVQVFLEKFKPNVWVRYDWGFFKTLHRYLAVIFYCFFVLAVDCNNFFLNTYLRLSLFMWVPPEHKILQVRLAIWAFSAIAATKEYYEYNSNPYCRRVGPFIWLTCFTLLVEFSIIIRFGTDMFTAPFPWYVVLMWTIIGIMTIIGGVVAYRNEKKYGNEYQNISDQFSLNDPQVEVEQVSSYRKKND